MSKKSVKVLLVSLVVLIGASGCKDKDEVIICEGEIEQTLKVTIQPVFGSSTLYIDSVYSTVEGYDVRFTSLKFFATNINGSNGEILDAALFDYAETGTDFLEMKASKEDAPSLSGNIGVSPTLNSSDPSGFPAAHPLNILNASDLHWGWNPGYIFMQVQAQVDTIPDGIPLFDHIVIFHIGRDAYLQTFQYDNINWQQISNSEHQFPLKLDLATFLQNGSETIDLKTEYISHTNPGQEALSLKVIQNLNAALSPY